MAKERERGRDPETLRMYWQVQLERNAQLEDQRLGVSNFVVAGSVVALGIFSVNEIPSLTATVLGAAVVLANLLAAVFSQRSEKWARLHKARAKRLLQENWPYLADLQVKAETDEPRPHGAQSVWRRQGLQRAIHWVLMAAAAGLVVITWLS